MALDARKRRQILETARQWSGIPYDHSHGDVTWRDPSPTMFDCSTFVCRVAVDALGYEPSTFAAGALWLLDNLVEVDEPRAGDIVGYGRAASGDEYLAGHDVVWHVMIYSGPGSVIGACDIAGEVTTRPIEYESGLGDRRWKLIDKPTFRALELRPGTPVATVRLKKRRA